MIIKLFLSFWPNMFYTTPIVFDMNPITLVSYIGTIIKKHIANTRYLFCSSTMISNYIKIFYMCMDLSKHINLTYSLLFLFLHPIKSQILLSILHINTNF